MYYLAIDLGGTNIKAGLVDENGNIINRAQRPTGAHRSFEEILSAPLPVVLHLVFVYFHVLQKT